MKSFKDIVETIFQMEEEMDLFNQKIDGVYFWELIRFNVVSQIAQQSGVYGQAHTKPKRNSKLAANITVNAVKNIFIKNPFFAQKSDILFIGHPRRKLMEDGLWWDIYCDPVMEYLGQNYKCLLLENPYLNSHLTPAKTSHIKYFDLVHFLGIVSRELKLVCSSISEFEHSMLKVVQMNIMNTFNVSIDINKLVSTGLSYRKSLLPYYLFILNMVRPKLVVVLVSYGNEVVIEACKKRFIPVIEFQHGTFSRYHTAYSFPGSSFIKTTFPDYLFTFGEYWSNLVDFPISKDMVFSVGYPYFEMEMAKYKNEQKKNQIVFISQGSIGAKLSKFAVELGGRQDLKMDIIYKLHPGEYDRWKKEYPWLVTSNVRVIDNESVPLYKLLAQSELLIGVYSTVVYEGVGMGLKTILLNLPGIEYMEDLIESNVVSVVDSTNEFMKIIKNPSPGNASKAEKFFRPNALVNIAAALDEIIRTARVDDIGKTISAGSEPC